MSPHAVLLTWQPSDQAMGYRVYRASESGGPYHPLNRSLIAGPLYVDDQVESGAVYFYVVTAEDALGMESSPSGEVRAEIPSP